MTPNKLSSRGHGARPLSTLHGVWRKDFQSSDMDAMRRAMDAMQLSKFHKMAALKMVDGLAVDLSPDAASATVRFLTRVPTPFYSIQESYAKGKETHMGRRDLRAGRQRAVAHALGPRGMAVELKWEGTSRVESWRRLRWTTRGGWWCGAGWRWEARRTTSGRCTVARSSEWRRRWR